MADGRMTGLPISVASPVDLGRLIREAEALDNNLSQDALRSGEEATSLPKMSQLLSQTVELNKLDMLVADDRKLLQQFLISIRDRAPRMHMSFSADPSPQFIAKLTAWIRENIHPLVLITLGLQPNIGAGAIVRTTNKYFDLSIGKSFKNNREMLMKQLRESVAEENARQDAEAATEPAEVAA